MMDTAVTTQTPRLQFKRKRLLLELKVVSHILYLSQTFPSLYLFFWSKWVVWNNPPILTTQLCENVCGLTFRITSPGSKPITAALVLSQHNSTRNANASTHRDRRLRMRIPFFWDMTLSNRIPTFRRNVLVSMDPTRLTQRYIPFRILSNTDAKTKKLAVRQYFAKYVLYHGVSITQSRTGSLYIA
jgi:hypothetical protein